jgi:magnesium transporter
MITKPIIDPGNGFRAVDALLVAGISSLSMFAAVIMASLIGTMFPLILTKMKIDPAVASGPFITTINDIIAVLIYYGLTCLFFFTLF